ncbi:OLC1v1008695C1 [Oldenlandia corymbosa var. corymbosa]|uniref:OLC1v1008695C1 n=1 Tax=Oldenlandia corymbosa var. corymbosa TaxID=529605 RepID=A0AAV1DQJ4_OLDCO|nr:OLC1v1008695C1 [Oldenlandia corymbosa var. corymbosa]
MATSLADLLLRKQAKELSFYPTDFFSAGLVDQSNPLEWDVIIFGLEGTIYEGGFFQAKIEFTGDYPNNPPTVKFTSEMWHPNVYPDGTVCMSTLSPPGDDPYGYELAGERWLPVHTVETILLGVISLLWEPNDEAAANVDAAIEWRERRDVFAERVSNLVRRSQRRFLFGEETGEVQFFSGGAKSFSGDATEAGKFFGGDSAKFDRYFSAGFTKADKSFQGSATEVDDYFSGDARKADQYFSGGPTKIDQFLFGTANKDYKLLSSDYSKVDDQFGSKCDDSQANKFLYGEADPLLSGNDEEDDDDGEVRIVIFD